MYYQSQDVRASTLAISQSLKYRKTCLREYNSSKKFDSIDQNDENFSPLFQKSIKIKNNSIQMKKQSRRKTGSIGKIVRNNHSSEKKYQLEERIPLNEAHNFLNQKLQIQKDNQNVGMYKKLYEQNKVLNEALKLKIYQTPQTNTCKNTLMDMSNYRPESKTITKAFYPQLNNEEKFFNENQGHYQLSNKKLNMKYDSMLNEYEKKKNFIKEEILALKQKTSLENFSASKNSSTQENFNYENSQYNSRGNSLYNKQRVNQQKVSFKSLSASKGFASYTQKSKAVFPQNISNETENEIDSKFKAYQQKIQKHKQFEKRNSSTSKFSEISITQNCKLIQQPNNLKTSLISQQKIPDKCTSKSLQNDTVNIFADLLMKQIQKDEEVRVIKNNIKKFPVQEVQKVLKEKYSLNIDCQRLKLSTQEYDPFFESKQDEKSIEKLAWQFLNAYQIAQNFWKNLIIGKFSPSELSAIYDALNYSKRDKIQLNEFARQVSFHLNKTIRGRQIFESFRRLNPLTKENFISQLSKKQ